MNEYVAVLTLNLLRKCQGVFRSDYTISYFQCVRWNQVFSDSRDCAHFLRADHILRTPKRLQQPSAKPYLQPKKKKSHMYLTLQGEVVGNRTLGLGKAQVLEMCPYWRNSSSTVTEAQSGSFRSTFLWLQFQFHETIHGEQHNGDRNLNHTGCLGCQEWWRR